MEAHKYTKRHEDIGTQNQTHKHRQKIKKEKQTTDIQSQKH